jgi:hypothetical protein
MKHAKVGKVPREIGRHGAEKVPIIVREIIVRETIRATGVFVVVA